MRRTYLIVAAALMGGCGQQQPEHPPASQNPQPAPVREAPHADPLALPDGVLPIESLVAYADAALNYSPVDQFGPQHLNDSALIDREFAFEFPYSLEQTNFRYSYDTKREELKLTVQLEDNFHIMGDNYGDRMNYLVTAYQETPEGEDIGSNAFGASAQIKRSKNVRFGVGATTENQRPGIFKPEPYGSFAAVGQTLKMTPDEAREATAGLKLRVRGRLNKAPKSDRVVVCRRQRIKPTLDYPYDERWSECVLSAKFQLIEIVSPSAGVLASWRAT